MSSRNPNVTPGNKGRTSHKRFPKSRKPGRVRVPAIAFESVAKVPFKKETTNA